MEKIRPDTIKYLTYLGICLVTILFTYLLMKPRKTETHEGTSPIPPVEQFTDANGNQAVLMKQYVSSLEANKALRDSMAKVLNIKSKDIKEVDRVVIQIDTFIREKIVYIPTSPKADSAVITFKDDYVNIRAVGKRDSSYINFKLTSDTLTRIQRDRNPIFGRPSTDIILSHSNPYFVTTHGHSFSVQQKRPWFSIGVSVGYDVLNQKVSLGPTVTVPVKTFYKKR